MTDIVERLQAHGSKTEMEAADEIKRLQIALCESLVLQSHYAILLNRFDDGNRLTFATAKDWIDRLYLIGRLKK